MNSFSGKVGQLISIMGYLHIEGGGGAIDSNQACQAYYYYKDTHTLKSHPHKSYCELIIVQIEIVGFRYLKPILEGGE